MKTTSAHPPLIEDYALIGDLHTAALVSRYGSVDWLCLPRFDSDSVFTALLGDESHGHWRIAPVAAASLRPADCQPRWQYRPDTLILETRWRTADGEVKVTDFMPPRADAAAAQALPSLVRIVTGVSGAVDFECSIKLRFGYGSVLPWVRRADHALHAMAGPDSVWIDAGVPLTSEDHAHVGRFTVRPGDQIPFVLTWLPSHLQHRPPLLDPVGALAQTAAFWTEWASRCDYQGRYAPAVIRSLITLKALTYAPTGGIIAAATTSLPEDIGGVRNWDYRYCWLRDATIVLEGLLRTGYTDEAAAWRGWLSRAVAGLA